MEEGGDGVTYRWQRIQIGSYFNSLEQSAANYGPLAISRPHATCGLFLYDLQAKNGSYIFKEQLKTKNQTKQKQEKKKNFMWLIKPKIFTTAPLTNKFANPSLDNW